MRSKNSSPVPWQISVMRPIGSLTDLDAATLSDLVARFNSGDRLALARLVSLIAQGVRIGPILDSVRRPVRPARVVALTGAGGVGKSTLARILGERLNAQRMVEPEDNQFLRAFYDGEPGAAFQAQLTFLIRRFEQLRSLDLSAH